MRYISLCSGVAGLDRALDQVGGECIVQVEIEPYCRSILDLRYPTVPKHDDLRTFHYWDDPLARALDGGQVDLVAGGIPCQPISHAGRRKGADDPRWLWPDALRIVREAQPRMVFFENPMGLRTLGLDGILAELTDMGYGGAWEVVAAADVGAPHLRKRIFIMGIAGRTGWEGPTRPPSNRGIRLWPTPREQDHKHYAATDYVAAFPQTWPTPTTRDYKDTGDSIANGTVPVNGLLGRAVGPTKATGALSPDWVEWLCGVPQGWSDITKSNEAVGPVHGWDSEPAIPRVGLGIPNRAKRLTALGNIVVPPQATFAWVRLCERLGTER